MLECATVIVMVIMLSRCFGKWKFRDGNPSNNKYHAIKDTQSVLAYIRHSGISQRPNSYRESQNKNLLDLNSFTYKPLRLSDRVNYNIEKFNFSEDLTSVKTDVKNELNNNTEYKTRVSKEHRRKVTHVGFLKVHKAGSTTMQNMFFRFGLRNNLTFALPKSGHYLLGTQGVLPIRNGSHRDILACHSAYRSQIFDKLLPLDSVKIGIIREPLDRMISAAYYYRDVLRKPYLRKVPKKNFIVNLINNSSIYDKDVFSRTKNSMGRDFGFSPDVKSGDTLSMNKRLKMLKKEFGLVLIVEEFDVSLVLMKRLLNWQLSDIIYIQSNNHTHTTEKLDEATMAKFKEINFLDQALYETFYEVFKLRVKEAGVGLTKEVTQFRKILKLVKTFCESAVTGDQLLIPKSKWNQMFKMTHKDCELIVTDELKFVSIVRERHRKMHSLE